MKRKQNAAIILIFLLFIGIVPVSVYATEATRQQIEAAEQEKNETQSQLDSTRDNLGTLNEKLDTLEGTLATLNTELSQVSNNLSELETMIADKEAEIEATNEMIEVANQELEEATALKDKQYETMKLQIQFMYETSEDLYLEMIFSAGNFAELLNRSGYIEQLSAYEQKTLQEYMDTQAKIEDMPLERFSSLFRVWSRFRVWLCLCLE